ncbi:nickel transporter permease [Paenisporosarcina sp. TG20]|uniref:nickel transporter permease n=1 Tax=Paenisporosarcina sp. TG20 TaxID=1211706 RepID=UPI0002FA1DF8|nr:nickel transporter permease [Paenisporosarcina sp. TG20]
MNPVLKKQQTPPVVDLNAIDNIGEKTEGFYKVSFDKLRKNKLAMFGLYVILLNIIMAVFAPLIAPHDPTEMFVKNRLEAPSSQFFMGTDEFGRDIFSRIIYGAQISLKVGIISVGIGIFFGVFLGLISGYFGKLLDNVISRFMDVLFSFPDILLAIAIMAVLGSNITNVMIAIGIVSIPIFARITRSAVLSVRESQFIEAAKSTGVKDIVIIFRHILPNISAPIIVQSTLSLAFAIIAEASLSFLGLGTQPPSPSWGLMLNTGRGFMETSPWVAIFPGLAIMITVLSFNVLGDGLRDALDPRLKKD